MHIRLDKDMTIENGHEIASGIEETIKGNFDIITTIHIEPLKADDNPLSTNKL
jgi:divalent metal cation (Fe/Co/Zn/Cd) transporter